MHVLKNLMYDKRLYAFKMTTHFAHIQYKGRSDSKSNLENDHDPGER